MKKLLLKSLEWLWTYFFYWVFASVYYILQLAFCLILMAILTVGGGLWTICDLVKAIGNRDVLDVLWDDISALLDLSHLLDIHDEILINCGFKEDY